MSRYYDIDPMDIDPDTGRPYSNYSSPSLDTSFHDGEMDWDDDEESNELATLRAQNAVLQEILEPFAAMGRVMEIRARVTFGKVPADSEIVCESSGEAGMGILTMGHFRDAAALLPDAPGWSGQYKPRARNALAQVAGPNDQPQAEGK